MSKHVSVSVGGDPHLWLTMLNPLVKAPETRRLCSDEWLSFSLLISSANYVHLLPAPVCRNKAYKRVFVVQSSADT